MNRVTLCIFILFSLALGLSIPNWLEDDTLAPESNAEEAWVPNYQANKLRSTLYDKDGNVNHQVYAETMENFDLLGFTLFKRPEYLLFAQTQQPWKVYAQEGTLYDDQRVQFETDVAITSQDQQAFVQTIKTSFVEINLLDKTMNSDQAVEIIGPNYVINSNGFTVSLETQTYELLDHVETIYHPINRD